MSFEGTFLDGQVVFDQPPPLTDGVRVRVTFEAETTYSEEQQRSGWQAILDNFKKHVEGGA